MQDASETVLALQRIAGYLRFARQPKFKIAAYEQAARVVAIVGDELGALVEQGQLRSLKGIGRALEEQIRDIWNTGSSSLLERLAAENPPGAAELIALPGLSPARIRALHSALGIASIADLRAACVAGKVREVRGFGTKTEQRLLAACDQHQPPQGSPPRKPKLYSDALSLAEELEQTLVPGLERVAIAGEVRRGEELVEALDLVVAGDDARTWELLDARRDVLRLEPLRGVAHLADGTRLRVRTAELERWGNALVDATGNAAHLALLRARARERGIDLDRASFRSERDLYEALGLPFIVPEQRSGVDECERAVAGELSSLVELSDIRGLVHCHTTYSDGRHSVLEMAEAAAQAGMSYITITDHSPSAYYAKGVAIDQLKRQWEEIAAANEKASIRVLRGVESDILKDGSLDYPDSILEQLEVIVASIHSRYRMSGAEMTERLVRALSLPLFKIWGHGLGRILNHRLPIECDVPAALDALAGSAGAIELNADPYRLDLPPRWIPEAKARKIPFVVSVDAHSTRGFAVLRYGITMARRGGLTAREVLNTLPADEFARAVRPTAARHRE